MSQEINRLEASRGYVQLPHATFGYFDAVHSNLKSGEFTTKDSGKRVEFESGMRRDTQEGKPRYDLIDRDFLKRWALLMTRGADKYGAENWRKANSQEELDRFKASALRHLMQYLEGDREEDHAAAVAFNLAAAEYVRSKLEK